MTLVIKNGSVPSKTSDGKDVSVEISLLPGAQQAIQAAVDGLAADPHASSIVSLPVNVLLYNEYPKAIGDKTVNSKEEEDALLAAQQKAPADSATTTDAA